MTDFELAPDLRDMLENLASRGISSTPRPPWPSVCHQLANLGLVEGRNHWVLTPKGWEYLGVVDGGETDAEAAEQEWRELDKKLLEVEQEAKRIIAEAPAYTKSLADGLRRAAERILEVVLTEEHEGRVEVPYAKARDGAECEIDIQTTDEPSGHKAAGVQMFSQWPDAETREAIWEAAVAEIEVGEAERAWEEADKTRDRLRRELVAAKQLSDRLWYPAQERAVRAAQVEIARRKGEPTPAPLERTEAPRFGIGGFRLTPRGASL